MSIMSASAWQFLSLRRYYRAIAIAGTLLVILGACTNEARYRAIQQNRLQACEQIPIAQQASCKAQYQTDYETYRRERDAATSS